MVREPPPRTARMRLPRGQAPVRRDRPITQLHVYSAITETTEPDAETPPSTIAKTARNRAPREPTYNRRNARARPPGPPLPRDLHRRLRLQRLQAPQLRHGDHHPVAVAELAVGGADDRPR